MTTSALQEAPQLSLLDIPGCQFTATGLTIEPGLAFDQWERIGRALEIAEKGVQWWIGDWLAYGEREYKETYAQAIETTGRSKQTLMNYCFVAKAIETSRRREVVDFTTHAEVASLTPKQQEKVLEKAAQADLSVKEVRREVHKIKREEGREKSEIELLHTPEVQEYLKGYLDKLKEIEEGIPLTAKFLRIMVQAQEAQVYWQLNRTIVDECEVIFQAVDENSDSIGADDLFTWLHVHGFFMSREQLDERLEYMCEDSRKMLKAADAGHGKQEDRRGKLPTIYKRWFKDWDEYYKKFRPEDDDEDAA